MAVRVKKLVLARWGVRFLAWLIDIIVVGLMVATFLGIIGWWAWSWSAWTQGWAGVWRQRLYFPLSPWRMFLFAGLGMRGAVNAIALFLYWTICDSVWGQSLGKKALRIRVADLSGKKIDILKAAIESFGKAFILPLDWFIGVIAFEGKRQRLFNYLSDTIVIRTEARPPPAKPRIIYVKE